MPDENGEVVTKYSSQFYPGYNSKSLAVTSNTKNGTRHVLSFTGNVIDSAAVIK